VVTTTKIPTQADAQQALVKYEDIATTLAPAVTVSGPESYDLAAFELRSIKASLGELDTLRKTMTQPLDQAKRAILNLFSLPESRLKQAQDTRRRAILDYDQEQERKRRAEEARLRDLQRMDEEKAEAKAAKLRERGKEEQADAVLAAVAPVPTVVLADRRPSGISIPKTWKADVIDLSALISHIANNPEHGDWLEAKIPALNAFARSTKGNVNIPGVRFYEDASVSARG